MLTKLPSNGQFDKANCGEGQSDTNTFDLDSTELDQDEAITFTPMHNVLILQYLLLKRAATYLTIYHFPALSIARISNNGSPFFTFDCTLCLTSLISDI